MAATPYSLTPLIKRTRISAHWPSRKHHSVAKVRGINDFTYAVWKRDGGPRAARARPPAPLRAKRAMKTFRSLIARLRPSTSEKLPTIIALPDRSDPWIAERDARLNARGTTKRPIPPLFNEAAAHRSYRNRFAFLLAVIAVPAMAAPGDFGAIAGAAPTEAEMVSARLAAQLAENPAMPFERPGMSFPGSAFYFLADPPSDGELVALPTTDALDTGAAEAGRELGEIIDTGPSANPFFSGSGLNHQRAQQCLAQAVWYEAASESEAGQRAVAQVVLNRVAHPNWPGSVCGVVYQGSQRSTGCQFSFTCDGSLARRANGASWSRAQRIASDALSGDVYRPVGHATHYHTLWVNPYWAPSLDHVGTIGAHRFYRNRGAAGRKEAFTVGYAGVEPGVRGRTSSAPAVVGSDLPLPELPAATSRDSASTPAFTPSRAASASPASRSTSAPVIEPILADQSLSGAGQTREEYARAGQWKSDSARDALEAEQRQLAQQRPTPAPAP